MDSKALKQEFTGIFIWLKAQLQFLFKHLHFITTNVVLKFYLILFKNPSKKSSFIQLSHFLIASAEAPWQ